MNVDGGDLVDVQLQELRLGQYVYFILNDSLFLIPIWKLFFGLESWTLSKLMESLIDVQAAHI